MMVVYIFVPEEGVRKQSRHTDVGHSSFKNSEMGEDVGSLRPKL